MTTASTPNEAGTLLAKAAQERSARLGEPFETALQRTMAEASNVDLVAFYLAGLVSGTVTGCRDHRAARRFVAAHTALRRSMGASIGDANPTMEADRRVREYIAEHPGTPYGRASRMVFNADAELAQRYAMWAPAAHRSAPDQD